MLEPAITLITPALNAAASLTRALSSLAGQGIEPESIVVDGGSSDGTCALARSQPGTRVIAAPGSSIYEALNLGLAAAQAPIIGFLNADDALIEGALAAVLAEFARDADSDIVRGRAEFVTARADGSLQHDTRNERRAAGKLGLDTILRGPVAINSLFFRRGLFERIGRFDTAFRLAADRDWVLRAWRANARIAELDRPLYRYYIHPGSATLDPARRNYRAIRREHLSIVGRMLTEPGADAALAPRLRRWHAHEVGLLAIDLARHGEGREAATVMQRAFTLAPGWPIDFAADTLAWTTARLTRERNLG